MVIDIYNQQKEKTGTFELSDTTAKKSWNPALVHQVIMAMEANKRKPWAHVKDRSEVSGGGKKPWRQKHTGRARVGSSRSPLWAHGGVTFGPMNERSYKQKINKKMKAGAFANVLMKKIHEGEVFIIDTLELPAVKTKHIADMFFAFLKKKKNPSVLIVVTGKHTAVIRAVRNIENAKGITENNINLYDCLKYRFLFFEKEALKGIVEKV